MAGNVVPWRGVTKLDLPIEQILERAKDANLETVVVMGWDKDGSPFFASSTPDGGDVLWLMEMTKKRLLDTET